MLHGPFNGGVAVFLYGVVALVLLLVGEDEVVRPLVKAACIFTFIPPSHICAYPPVCYACEPAHSKLQGR
jgi:hypothetical protein